MRGKQEVENESGCRWGTEHTRHVQHGVQSPNPLYTHAHKARSQHLPSWAVGPWPALVPVSAQVLVPSEEIQERKASSSWHVPCGRNLSGPAARPICGHGVAGSAKCFVRFWNLSHTTSSWTSNTKVLGTRSLCDKTHHQQTQARWALRKA